MARIITSLMAGGRMTNLFLTTSPSVGPRRLTSTGRQPLHLPFTRISCWFLSHGFHQPYQRLPARHPLSSLAYCEPLQFTNYITNFGDSRFSSFLMSAAFLNYTNIFKIHIFFVLYLRAADTHTVRTRTDVHTLTTNAGFLCDTYFR